MKKDQSILVLFLAVIIISGGIIYILKDDGGAPLDTQGDLSGADVNAAIGLKAMIASLEGTLSSSPDSLDILVDLGNAYYDLNEPGKSVEYYERALRIEPDNATVMVDCGAMYRELGNPDRAIELFEAAIKINPRFPQAYFNLGVVLRMEKADLKGAARAWKKYLEIEPNVDPQVRELLEDEIKAASGS